MPTRSNSAGLPPPPPPPGKQSAASGTQSAVSTPPRTRRANFRAAGGGGAASPPAAASSSQRMQCFKTKRCRFWLEGRCSRGETCTYAHLDVELRPPPDLTKTKLCSGWKQNLCTKTAEECAYAHGIDDLRLPGGGTPTPASAKQSSGNSADAKTPAGKGRAPRGGGGGGAAAIAQSEKSAAAEEGSEEAPTPPTTSTRSESHPPPPLDESPKKTAEREREMPPAPLESTDSSSGRGADDALSPAKRLSLWLRPARPPADEDFQPHPNEQAPEGPSSRAFPLDPEGWLAMTPTGATPLAPMLSSFFSSADEGSPGLMFAAAAAAAAAAGCSPARAALISDALSAGASPRAGLFQSLNRSETAASLESLESVHSTMSTIMSRVNLVEITATTATDAYCD